MRRPRPLVAMLVAAAFTLQPLVAAGAVNTERDLGRRFYLEARSQLPLIDDPVANTYIEGLGKRLVASLGPQEFDYRFFVVAHPAINAFAVPGGYVFVFSGLIAKAANDDEIAGVLGHEISHVHAHHIVREQSSVLREARVVE